MWAVKRFGWPPWVTRRNSLRDLELLLDMQVADMDMEAD